jgi:glycosyltransferase involved in cell wall biosynthesis
MRIVIDMQGAQTTGSRTRGIGRYTLSITKAIIRNKGEHEIILALSGLFPDTIESIRAIFDDILPQENIRVWYAPGPIRECDLNNEWRREFAESVREAFLISLSPDLILVSSLFEGLGDDAVISIDKLSNIIPTAVILYDLIPLIWKDIYLEDPKVDLWYKNKLEYLKRANLLLSISESSCQDGIRYLNFSTDLCINISTATDEHFKPIKVSEEIEFEVRKRYGLNKTFIMYTGGIDYRKNIEGLIRAYAKLSEVIRSKHQLAIICSVQPVIKIELEALATKNGLKSGELVLTGFVSDEDLLILYNICKAFVFPSWYEGFGLPALEAMSCGKAVIAANTSSLPEVIGLNEALFNPRDNDSICEKIKQVLSDEKFRLRLEKHGLEQSKKFSWDRSAKLAIKAIEKLISKKNSTVPLGVKVSTLPKLAYVSPLPPERSGISDYSAELIPELSKYYDIDVVITQDFVSDTWINKNCKIRSVDWFKAHPDYYDRVLYHFGNSKFHQHMFKLLEEMPGVVVLHDFFLSGVVAYMDIIGYQPNCCPQYLYNSHGYQALSDYYHVKDIMDVVYKYPINLPVLQNSKKVIVHSENSIRLAKKWYGVEASQKMSLIPLLRASVQNIDDIKKVKVGLGFPEEAFIICSFGMVNQTKLNHRLLSAFLNSSLSTSSDCYLVFVGENDTGDYGSNLLLNIKNSMIKNRIKITDWTDIETFRCYLRSADMAVQLRTLSRGETSAAVLDCMNYGLPTIVNANGSMADLSKDAVLMLPDEFTDSELVVALESLYENRQQRLDLSKNAREIIKTKHDPTTCAKQYFEVIENTYNKDVISIASIINSIISTNEINLEESKLIEISNCLAKDFPLEPYPKQLFVDISKLVEGDLKTGVHRVTRSILKELLENPPDGYVVEPVYTTANARGYYYARQFTIKFLDVPASNQRDELVDYHSGDIFIGLELHHHFIISHKDYLMELRRDGVKVFFVVYDLLSVLMPKFFYQQLEIIHNEWLRTICSFDGAICISRSVAEEFAEWHKNQNLQELRQFKINWFHLGADIDNSVPTFGLPDNLENILNLLLSKSTFLTVGTIEPRKGQTQILSAFELLWKQGVDINLVIVGRQGWMVEPLVKRLYGHRELNKRLFWLEGISDEYLGKIYSISTCLIAASEGEGFGLPLVEAAKHKLPIIARDIPVFREVASSNAFYFSGLEVQDLSRVINEWLKLNKDGQAPQSMNMPWQTWRWSTQQLLKCIIPGSNSNYLPKVQEDIIIKTLNKKKWYIKSYFMILINRLMIALILSPYKKPLKKIYYKLRLNKVRLFK